MLYLARYDKFYVWTTGEDKFEIRHDFRFFDLFAHPRCAIDDIGFRQLLQFDEKEKTKKWGRDRLRDMTLMNYYERSDIIFSSLKSNSTDVIPRKEKNEMFNCYELWEPSALIVLRNKTMPPETGSNSSLKKKEKEICSQRFGWHARRETIFISHNPPRNDVIFIPEPNSHAAGGSVKICQWKNNTQRGII